MPTPYYNSPNVCRFCDDNINATENQQRLCNNCLEEVVIKCQDCGRVGINDVEFVSEYINDIRFNYCLNCYRRNIVNCTECGEIFKSTSDSVCEICSRLYCTTHRNSHTCNSHMSMPYRPYGRNNKYGTKLQAKVIKNDRLVGVELEAVGGNPKKLDKLYAFIGISDDASLKGNNPIEIQTPPASANLLEKIIDNASDTLKLSGYKTNKSCGLHIHIDCSDFKNNGNKILRVLNTYYAVEPIILRMLPKSRRNNPYALPLTRWINPISLEQLKNNKRVSLNKVETEWYKTGDRRNIERCKKNKYDSSRYYGINLHALLSNGHIEIRYHHGTINKHKIKNWIKLHLAVIDWALNDYSKEKLDVIQQEKIIKGKVKKLARYFMLDKYMARYIRKQIRKFNTLLEDNE